MNREIQQRLVWVKLFEEINDAGLVALDVAFLDQHYASGGNDILSKVLMD
jgi:hypothetical protein